MRLTTHPQRIACLWFPEWPVQRLLALHPEWRRFVLLIVEQTRRGEFVRHVNRIAYQRGVRVGMPVSEARSCLRSHDDLLVEPVRSAEDRKALGELASQCDAFSPRIGLEEEESPACLLLDVAGIAPFFAGEEGLTNEIQKLFHQHGYETRFAVADTVGSAWAAVHCLTRTDQSVVMPPGDLAPFLPLPVAALRLQQSDLTKLGRLGIKTIQQLLNLDRLSLRTRFGADLLLRIDQITGEREESISPYLPPPRFHVEHNVEEGVSHPEAIEQFWMTLLQQLLTKLQANGLGTRHVDLEFIQDGKAQRCVEMRVCETSSDVKHLSDLLRLKLEQHPWDGPLLGIKMEAKEVAPLSTAQHQLFSGGSQDDMRQFSMLLNRLHSRLGQEAVVRPHLLPDLIPERAVQFISVTDHKIHSPSELRKLFFPTDRPTRLFPKPRAIDVITTFPDGPPCVVLWGKTQLEAANYWGPERIESGWWGKSYVRREYYWVETSGGQWLWLFKQITDGRWFWHGEL